MTNDPVRVGAALAITAGIGYTACALVFWLVPGTAAQLMSALFHGLDFTRLQATPGAFSVGGFVVALIAIVVWVFVLGAVWASLLNRLGGDR